MADGNQVCVVGAAGRVGLPFALVLADAGYSVWGLDIAGDRVARLNAGRMPFREDGGPPRLAAAHAAGALAFTTDPACIPGCAVVVVMLGTPADCDGDPSADQLTAFVEANHHRLRAGQLVVLRSTLAPGTTDALRERLATRTGLVESRDYVLACVPERVKQGEAIAETRELPNLVGTYTQEAHARTAAFLAAFSHGEAIALTPREAEVGKLITNAARYISFAVANEVYLLCQRHGVAAHRVIAACNHGYPRLDLPAPGPNVGGPCLAKDGKFLVEGVPFGELIRAATTINESLPIWLADRARSMARIERAVILGMTFKAEADDPRHSLSFRLHKTLVRAGIAVARIDPYLPESDPWAAMAGADAAFVMTPHAAFRDLDAVAAAIGNPACLMVDVWELWGMGRDATPEGFFTLGERAAA